MSKKFKISLLTILIVLTLASCEDKTVKLETFLTNALFLNIFFIIGFFAVLYFWFEGFPINFEGFPINELRQLLSLAYSLVAGAFIGFYGSCFINGIIILVNHYKEIKMGSRLEFPAFEGLGWWIIIAYVLIYAVLNFEFDIYLLGNRILGSLLLGILIGLPALLFSLGYSAREIEEWHVPFSYSLIASLLVAFAVRIRFYLVGFDLPEPENKKEGEKNEQRQRTYAKGN